MVFLLHVGRLSHTGAEFWNAMLFIAYDISKYRAGYMDILIQENLIGWRFKSEDSIFI